MKECQHLLSEFWLLDLSVHAGRFFFVKVNPLRKSTAILTRGTNTFRPEHPDVVPHNLATRALGRKTMLVTHAAVGKFGARFSPGFFMSSPSGPWSCGVGLC